MTIRRPVSIQPAGQHRSRARSGSVARIAAIGLSASILGACAFDPGAIWPFGDDSPSATVEAPDGARVGAIGLYRDVFQGRPTLFVGNNSETSVATVDLALLDGSIRTVVVGPLEAVPLDVTEARIVAVR